MPRTLITSMEPNLRNLIINGGLDFNQRATPTFISTAAQYLFDRFRWGGSGLASLVGTHAKVADAPPFSLTNTLLGSNHPFTNSLRLTVGTGASPGAAEQLSLSHHIEGFDYAAIHGKPFRHQLWIKASKTGTMGIAYSNGAASNRRYITTVTINTANTWELKTIDIVGDSTGTWAFDATAGLRIDLSVAQGVNFHTTTVNQWASLASGQATTSAQTNFVSTAGDQIWFGPQMIYPGAFDSRIILPFVRAGRLGIQQELAMCQRYFEKSYNVDVAPGTGSAFAGRIFGLGSNADSIIKGFNFLTAKRSTPTIVLYSPSTGVTGAIRTYSNNVVVTGVSAGGIGHNGVEVITGFTPANNAMYDWHFTADCDF